MVQDRTPALAVTSTSTTATKATATATAAVTDTLPSNKAKTKLPRSPAWKLLRLSRLLTWNHAPGSGLIICRICSVSHALPVRCAALPLRWAWRSAINSESLEKHQCVLRPAVHLVASSDPLRFTVPNTTAEVASLAALGLRFNVLPCCLRSTRRCSGSKDRYHQSHKKQTQSHAHVSMQLLVQILVWWSSSMLRGLSKENLPAEWLVATLCACTVSLLRAKSHRSSRAFPAHRDRGAGHPEVQTMSCRLCL